MKRHVIAALVGLVGATAAACVQSPDSAAAGQVDLTREPRVRLVVDPLAARADSLVRAGRPWRASALVATRLRIPAAAVPELRLAGARAAAGWEGWSEVERILRGAPWLDTQFEGEGRELLARSLLERGVDAVRDAQLALADARSDANGVARRVLLARAYDRTDARDSAASAYEAAASRLAGASDWLRLRAAGVTADSGARAALFVRVRSAAARVRVQQTDAQARERSGDFAGAARIFRSLGAEGSAFRVEALAARDEPAKSALVQRIVAYLGGRSAVGEVRQSIDLLDRVAPALAPAQELVVARAAAENGLPARAVAGFTRAGTTSLSAGDRVVYAGALLRSGRAAEAARQFGAVSDPALAPAASYQRARALLQAGDGAGARATLRATAASYSLVPAAAAPALLLLADLQVDDGDLAGGARTLSELGRRYPEAPQAALGRFRAGLLAWNADPGPAAATFDTLINRYPDDDEAVAARYWAGRAHERAGRRADAEKRWREVIALSPLSYYAVLSARRLRAPGWTPPPGPDTVPHVAAVDSALRRAATLERLGMDVESRFEYDALAERAERLPTDAAAVAQGLIAAGQPARGLRVALRALDCGATSRALYRAAYPVVHQDALVEEARRNDLDPALVAGLIRQESSFNPRAVSSANARGLMQLLPSVGQSVAASRGYPLWNPALLFDPDVNLELGTAHLRSSLRPGTAPATALAAYNAGASRVARWMQRPGAEDPELFTEWIPYAETRDYVRIVQRNAAVYGAMYGW